MLGRCLHACVNGHAASADFYGANIYIISGVCVTDAYKCTTNHNANRRATDKNIC